MRIFDFLNILSLLTIFTGIVIFAHWILSKKYAHNTINKKENIFIEYCRSFFPVFLIVLIIRAFIFQPYRVPTGSLEPSIMPGDLIFVTQYDYGLKIPLWDKVLLKVGSPQRGQIALFRWPVNPKLTFVKRVIGLPGDNINYINKIFYINGIEQKQQLIGNFQEALGAGKLRTTKRYLENLNGIKHYIITNSAVSAHDFRNLRVPNGMYFMIGDNRDDSDDSRSWGFVPQNNFVGHAIYVWFNINFNPFSIGWDRIGTKLYGSL